MSAAQIIKVYRIFTTQFSDEEAKEIIHYVETCQSKQSELATKQDIQDIRAAMIKWIAGTGASVVLAIAGILKLIIK